MPEAAYVSLDGLVKFDEKGERLDSNGHGTGTYTNVRDLYDLRENRPASDPGSGDKKYMSASDLRPDTKFKVQPTGWQRGVDFAVAPNGDGSNAAPRSKELEERYSSFSPVGGGSYPSAKTVAPNAGGGVVTGVAPAGFDEYRAGERGSVTPQSARGASDTSGNPAALSRAGRGDNMGYVPGGASNYQGAGNPYFYARLPSGKTKLVITGDVSGLPIRDIGDGTYIVENDPPPNLVGKVGVAPGGSRGGYVPGGSSSATEMPVVRAQSQGPSVVRPAGQAAQRATDMGQRDRGAEVVPGSQFPPAGVSNAPPSWLSQELPPLPRREVETSPANNWSAPAMDAGAVWAAGRAMEQGGTWGATSAPGVALPGMQAQGGKYEQYLPMVQYNPDPGAAYRIGQSLGVAAGKADERFGQFHDDLGDSMAYAGGNFVDLAGLAGNDIAAAGRYIAAQRGQAPAYGAEYAAALQPMSGGNLGPGMSPTPYDWMENDQPYDWANSPFGQLSQGWRSAGR